MTNHFSHYVTVFLLMGVVLAQHFIKTFGYGHLVGTVLSFICLGAIFCFIAYYWKEFVNFRGLSILLVSIGLTWLTIKRM